MQSFFRSLANKNQAVDPDAVRYAGLNIRLLANFFDMILLMLVSLPLMLFKPSHIEISADTPPSVVQTIEMHNNGQITNDEFTKQLITSGYVEKTLLPKILLYSALNFFIIGIIYILCWKKMNSTPGKLLFGIKIVDEKTLQSPTTGQYIIRFLGYIVSMMPLFIGFLMIPFNKKRRGLHDIMAGTVVIHSRPVDVKWEDRKNRLRIYAMIVLLIIGSIYLSTKMGN